MKLSNYNKIILFLGLILISSIILSGAVSAANITVIPGTDAIKNAINTAHSGDTLNINQGTYKEHNLVIDKNLTISGPTNSGHPVVTIDAQKQGRVLNINQGVNASLNYLIIENGYASYRGGGIYNKGELTITNCTIKNNFVTGGSDSAGGGIYNDYGNVTMINSTLSSNEAQTEFDQGVVDAGGGMYNDHGNVVIYGCQITDNTAYSSGDEIPWQYGSGGGISNDNGNINVHFSRIFENHDNIIDLEDNPAYSDIDSYGGTVNAEYNWWGTNFVGTNPVEAYRVSSNVDFSPWIVLRITANPTLLKIGDNSTITADLLHDNGILSDPKNPELYYHDPANGYLPDGIPVRFATTIGNIKSLSFLLNGIGTATLNNTVAGISNVFATIDSKTIQTSVTIQPPPTVTFINPVKYGVYVASDKVIKVSFSEMIKIETGWIEIKNYYGTSIPIETSINGNILTINHLIPFTNGIYNIILHTDSITDLAGNPLSLYTSSFSVGVLPTVISIDPIRNAVKVPINKLIKVTFSEPIKTGNNYIELKSSGGTSIPVKTSINGNILTINHSNLLANRTKYTLILHTGSLTSLKGNPIALYTSSFTRV